MEVDVDEFVKQIEQENRNAEEYLKVEIIVSKTCAYPHANLEVHRVGDNELAKLINVIDEMKKVIIKEHPEVLNIMKNIKVSKTIVTKEEKGGE